jgi:uroporphyrinogen-III synthase
MRTVVLTRPEPEAQHWQQLLTAQGLIAETLPLIEIAPLRDQLTVQALDGIAERLRQNQHAYRAVMFVSSNAVRHFLQHPGMGDAVQAAKAYGLRAWAPGPGTQQVLLQAGWPADAIDSPPAEATQFDSEALWGVVAPQVQPGDRVLIVRGASALAGSLPQGSGREWLAAQLRAAGAQVELVGVYGRQSPAATPALQARIAQLCADDVLWLFSSSEAIAHLRQIAPTQNWHTQRALATHPRIADAARAAGFGEVRQCKPGVMDVRASIESWV